MFCSNCGSQLAENALFCSGCGKAASTAPEMKRPDMEAVPAPIPMPAPVATEADSKSNFAESVLPKRNPVGMPEISAADVPVPKSAPEPVSEPVLETVPAPVSTKKDRKKPDRIKEKITFGKGALAFCIFLIALLSITAGIFAALYFNEIGFTVEIPSLW